MPRRFVMLKHNLHHWRLAVMFLRCLSGSAALLAIILAAAGASAEESGEKLALPDRFKPLLPLHTKLGTPLPGDWLIAHPEPGQTYAQYVRGKPVRPDRQRRVIYVQPLGDFDPTQQKILDAAAEYLGIYFQLPVKVKERMSLDVIPAKARRTHPTDGMPQILSTYVFHDVLRPKLPKDACVELALTTSDLWPGEGWNFVFGQASLSDRVGVWSIYRNGDPHEGEKAFRLCLRAHAEDGLARDGPHVLDAALHPLRVQHVRQQQPARKPTANPCRCARFAWPSSAMRPGPIR